VSGLAQTAADALPLPSHDDIYYHHQRLHLLDEDDASAAAERARQQQAKEQRLRDIKSEQENGRNGSSTASGKGRSRSLARRTSRQKVAGKEDRSLSKTVSQLSIRGEEKVNGGSRPDHDEEEASEWNMDDRELLESLALDAREHGQRGEIGSRLDTPVYRKVIEPSSTFASASKKYD